MAADNRATPEVPYGYIYFSDNTRIDYYAEGAFPGSDEHIELAIAYLREKFPEVKWDR